MPYVFTEQGVAMLSSVLKSKRAVQVSIGIVRVFVKLRSVLSTSVELGHRLDALERQFEKHDAELHAVFQAIRELMTPSPERSRKQIGFSADREDTR